VLDAAEGFVPPDPPELPLALAHVTEVGSRERTRIVCVYGLSEQLDGAERRLGVADLYPFGRFWPHVRAAAELLPNPVLSVREVDIELPGGGQDLGPARAILMVTPRGDAALVLDAEMTGDPDGQQVAHVLDVTCLKRGLLRLDGKTMIEWLRGQADASGLPLPDALALGANVHQCVFPGGALLAAIRGGATYWRLVYRVAAPREPTEQAGTFRPPELNYSGYVSVGHGRGVSVISGFARPVENVYALMVVMLVTGLGVLHRSRGRLFAAMKLVEAYQRSLCEAMGIRAGLEHSSRMHWAAYLTAFLPFIALVAAGWLLRRRIRASSGQLDVFEGARSERAR
jgi:hypothetical protein